MDHFGETSSANMPRQYDRDIESTLQSKDVESKKHMANVIDEMYSYGAALPQKMHANRKVLGNQIARIETEDDG